MLIIQRVANQSALTSNTIIPGHLGSFHVRSGRKSMGGGTLPGGYPMDSVDRYGKNGRELGIGVDVETTIDLHHDKV